MQSSSWGDKEFTASLPAELGPALEHHFARFGLSLADYGPLFEHLRATHHNEERVKILLAPANLHWCSDAALEMLAELSARYEAPMHMHLIETAYQKEYARRRGGGTALDYIDRFGFLGMKAHEGDIVEVRAPSGVEQIEVLEIRYGDARGETADGSLGHC